MIVVQMDRCVLMNSADGTNPPADFLVYITVIEQPIEH